MINKIEFIDHKGDIISPLELVNLKEYEKYIYVDNILKKIEHFENNIFTGGVVFLTSSDDLDDIIEHYNNKNESWAFKYDHVLSGDYEYWEVIGFYRGILKAKIREVTSAGVIIALQELNPSTNEIISTKKYYYDATFGNKNIFNRLITVFFDDEDNIVIRTFLDEDEVYDVDDYIERDDFMAVFNWHEHPYYHNALPLIPKGNL